MLENQSFNHISEFEMKDLLPLCNFRRQHTCLSFQVKADVDLKNWKSQNV